MLAAGTFGSAWSVGASGALIGRAGLAGGTGRRGRLKSIRPAKRADEYTDMWETSCGHAYTIIEGTPSDNHMEFCCYCGRHVDEEIVGSDGN